jgi:hypothetical protein
MYMKTYNIQDTETYLHKITNLPVFLYGVEILMRTNPLLGPLEGVGHKNLDFLGPNGTRFARYYVRAQKSFDF